MKILDKQIFKINGNGTIMEVMSNSLPIEKLQINFLKYDESKDKGNRVSQRISIYIDVPKALELCQDILSGKISLLADAERKKGAQYPKEVWSIMGGTSATKLANKGKSRPDGMSESRVMKIAPGSKMPFIFTAESGKGEENDKGLIVPKYGTKPEQRIFIGLDASSLKQFALMTKMHIEAFVTSQYCKDAFMKEVDKK